MTYRLTEIDEKGNRYTIIEGTYLECKLEKMFRKKKYKIEKIEEKNCNYTDQWQNEIKNFQHDFNDSNRKR